MKKHTLAIALLSMGTLFLVGCSDSDDDTYTPGERSTGQVIVLTSNGELASLDADAPTKLISNIKVAGLRSGDQLVGIDYRPKDGMLYGIGALGNIYTLNPSTGQASFKVALIADSTDASDPFSKIVGNPDLMTVNFNPVADRLRVMSNTGQNLRINVDTGATITDGTINSSDAVEVITAAYTNAVDGTISTRLISLDQRMDRIYLQDANAGTLSSYASLGVNTDGGAAIDIDAENNLAYAALKVAGKYQWAKLDLTTLGTSNNASSEWSALNSYFDTQGIRGLSIKPVRAMAYALGQNNQLLKFALTQPSKTTDMTISGLKVDEKIIGIDYRLRTETEHVGKLYALSNQANLYTIDSKTGAAKLVSTLSADSSDTTAPYTMLDGTHFAVDFNPVADRLRVVSNTGQNLRINVDTGATTTDSPLNGINNASVSAGAYTNSFKASKAPATTRLLNLDQTTNQLVEQIPPNNGTLSPIGNLGITLGMDSGFDIAAGENGLSYAVVSNGSSNTLYKINLMTGAATPAINVNTVPNLNASMVGTSSTPMLIDLAINLER